MISTGWYYRLKVLFKNARDSFFGNIFEIINYFSPIDQCYNKHFNWSVIGNLRTCRKFIITLMLLLILTVHLTYFCRKSLYFWGWGNNRRPALFTVLLLCCCSSWWVNFCCITNFLCFFTLETELILAYIYLFIPHNAFSWSNSETSKSILWLWSFCLVIAVITIGFADR